MTTEPVCLVIMGAAVWPGGEPSGAMRRRVQAALAASRAYQDPSFLVTGGLGRFPPSEAEVMQTLLLAAGVPPDRVILDPESRDTLASVVHCAAILRTRPFGCIVLCTDSYHIPRCRWLFSLAHVRADVAPISSGRAATGTLRWLYYYLRELVALPWDTLLILLRSSAA